MPVRFRLSESLLLLFLTGPKLYRQTNKKFGKCYMNSPEIWQSFVYNHCSTFLLCLSEVFCFFLFHVYLRDDDCKSILVKGQTHFVQVCKFILCRSIWPLKKCHSITIFFLYMYSSCTMLFFEMLCTKIPWYMNTVLPSLEGTVMHFQPFGFSPVFELFIYVSDLFLVLVCVSFLPDLWLTC